MKADELSQSWSSPPADKIGRGKLRTAPNSKRSFRQNLNGSRPAASSDKEKWGNLPGGEILPHREYQRHLRRDGVVAIIFYEPGVKKSVNDRGREHRIVDLRSGDKDSDDFRAYTSTDENRNRVGEFAIGTNTACTQVIGHICRTKNSGLHRLRSPVCRAHRRKLGLKTHIDCVGRDFDIWFDGEKIMGMEVLV